MKKKKKNRYSKKERIAITKYSYTAGKSVREVAQEYNINAALLYNWRRLYGNEAGKDKRDFRIYGPRYPIKTTEEKVSIPAKIIDYMPEQKAEFVKKSYEYKGSLTEFCRHHKLDRTLLYTWRKRAKKKDTKQKNMYWVFVALFLGICFGMMIFYLCF